MSQPVDKAASQALSEANGADAAAQDAARVFAEAVAIMARLRGPDGCPWDREQDFDTIRKHTLEEAYEVLDAIERRNWPDLRAAAGRPAAASAFRFAMAGEAGHFTMAEVIAGLNRKLVRRHPHVFGDKASRLAGNSAAGDLETRGIDSGQVLRNWDAIKLAETGMAASDAAKPSRLDSVLRSTPALMEAAKLGSRASKAGFDWPDAQGFSARLKRRPRSCRRPSPPLRRS